MSKQFFYSVLLLIFTIAISACSGGSGGSSSASSTPTNVSGAAQKGPFVQGSNVLVNILTNSGEATDATIVTQTNDSLGNFSFTTHHKGPVQIVADGYFFNELTGTLADGPLTLRGIYNITANGDQAAYVNVLTHLINNRVLYLIANDKHLLIDDALLQAQNELLAALAPLADIPIINDFSNLSVYNVEGTDATGNSFLLAVSSVFCQAATTQANNNLSSVTAELTLLLNTFSDDLAQDGIIDANLVLEQLQPAILELDAATISQHLETQSTTVLNATLPTPDLTPYINSVSISEQQNFLIIVNDSNDVGPSPDFSNLTLGVVGDSLHLTLEFTEDTVLATNDAYIYLYGTHRDMIRLSENTFDLARDPGSDGHFEDTLLTDTVEWLAADKLRIIIPTSNFPDLYEKELWAFSIPSQDRLPDSGTVSLAPLEPRVVDSQGHDLTIIDPDDVATTPDMTELSIDVGTDNIDFYLKFADPTVLDLNSVYIYLYGTNRDMFRVSANDFVLARDPGADGHFEQTVTTGTLNWLSVDELHIVILRTDMEDIGNKNVWAYSMDSLDRLPDTGSANTSNIQLPAPLPALTETIDFEGIASGTELTVERFTYQNYNEFQTYVWEGFYFPVDVLPAIHPDSGSDNLNTQRLEVSHQLGETFSIERMEIAERVNNVNLAPLKITGYLNSGGTIEQIFNADRTFGFETLFFDDTWSDLTKIDFYVDYGYLHFDNILVKKNTP